VPGHRARPHGITPPDPRRQGSGGCDKEEAHVRGPRAFGDPETFSTPQRLRIHLSGRERRLLATLLEGTSPTPADPIEQWAERLFHAALGTVSVWPLRLVQVF